MRRRLSGALKTLCSVCLIAPHLATAQVTVYDNTANYTGTTLATGSILGTVPTPNPVSLTLGDQVTLDGGSNAIIEVFLSTQILEAVAAPSATFGLRLYQMGMNNEVGPLISTPVTTNISLQFGAMAITWKDLNLNVPDTFIVAVSIQASLLLPQRINLGFPFYDPPTVGSSDNAFHYNAGGVGLAQGISALKTNTGNHNLSFRIVATSSPVVELNSPRVEGAQFRFDVTVVPGRFYRVESRDDLNSGNWTVLRDEVQAVDNTMPLSDPVARFPCRFYRAVLLP